MTLTDTAVRNARPKNKAVKLFDGEGLYLLVQPKGGRWWRFKYRFGGKERLLSFGTYPDVTLKDAREQRIDARRLLAQGVDPGLQRKAVKQSHAAAGANSFEAIGREWHEKQKETWSVKHAGRILRRLERDMFPWLGARPIDQIEAPEILECLRRIEARGLAETTHRAHRETSQIFRYAIATGRAKRDPAADLKGALKPVEVTHFASITDPKHVGPLLRAIDGYTGTFVVQCALRIAPYVFVRPTELRLAHWEEFDLDAAEWRIPAERMKMRIQHIVPLARQVVAILREIWPLTKDEPFVFPGTRGNGRPLSDNTINAALRSMDYSRDEMTGHGFRSMASTLLNEQGWNADAVERQLAHVEGNSVRAAYNYAQHLPERRKMMQAWADYLDSLKNEGKKK